MTRFFFAGDYRSHLIDILEGVADADPALGKEQWVRDTVDTVDKLTEEGRVPLLNNYARSLIEPLPFEPMGEPSRFLTLQWLLAKQKLSPR